jgi:hypothetical protein
LVSGPNPNLIESFFKRGHFRTQSQLFTTGWGSGTYWRALEVGGKRGLTMGADAWVVLNTNTLEIFYIEFLDHKTYPNGALFKIR